MHPSTPIFYSDEEIEQLIPIVQRTLKKEFACKPPYDEEAYVYYREKGTHTVLNLHEFQTLIRELDIIHFPGDWEIYKLIYRTPLEDMPLYISHEYLKPYAIWRLEIGK